MSGRAWYGLRGWGGIDLSSFLYFLSFLYVQDMAIARSCLTLWVYRILVPMCYAPPISAPGPSSNDQTQTPVGDGRGTSRLGLVQVT
jgi:hypothetical protein